MGARGCGRRGGSETGGGWTNSSMQTDDYLSLLSTYSSTSTYKHEIVDGRCMYMQNVSY